MPMSCPARLSVLLATLVLLASVSQSLAIAESGGYVKCCTWAETMHATRAACLTRLSGLPPSAGARPVAIGPIRGDGPGERVSVDVAGWQWLRLTSTVEQGAGNCHIWGEARLIAADGSETRLSSLEPAAVSVGWGELLKDKNWKGQPLQVGQQPFSHGIWVHGNSDVCYPLEGKYQRFEAWVGMDAARATGMARFRVHFDRPDIAADAWRKIAVDFPLESRWFAQDMGKGGPTPWFNDDRGDLSRMIVQRVLTQLGQRAESLQKECNELRRTDDAADVGWLELYTRACRCRECVESLDRIPLVELRAALEAEMATLAQASIPAADARWGAYLSRLRLIAGEMPEGREVALAGLRSSIENLSQAMPDRFASRDSLIARLDEAAPRWHTAIAAAVQGDAAATAKLPDVVREIGDFRGQIVRSFKGMSEFLAQPACSAMLEEWERQHAALEHDLGRRGHFAQVAAETFRTEALVLDSDRDPLDIVLRRTAALLENLQDTGAGPALGDSEKQLRELQAAAAAIDPAQREARFALFADACRVRREIAFANPLLRFDDVLFIKRHRAVYNHMCDQYYGITARPGGGLYVIADAFGARPEVRDLLTDSRVENGRLKGQRLSGGTGEVVPMSYDGVGNLNAPEGIEGGTFLSPDLSFDARSILFAYVEGRGDKGHDHHVDPTRGHWDPGRCYHIFRVNADGTNLVQLTDGTFNDFDPCWLPNGRIAFMSERRGGYLRCGRVCPTYTLFDMAADGSDIACLSFHETNEWHPSVTHDGRILYTRWDYVDRHGCTAHMPWITTLDGRDSRAVHGNFAPRPSRPDMEVDCRAIPGSQKFVATAAPHHGQAYGSLILIDPREADDDGMNPVRRITPDVGFPESQGGRQAYGTAWPLSEDYYLCVYDADIAQGKPVTTGDYGIYLVDSFGNKELIYRDPRIGCLSPIPLCPRPVPPVVPELAQRGPETNPTLRTIAALAGKEPQGTVAVMNVYESLKPWPEGTRITELRVLQVLPMTVPSGAPPHETGFRVATAGDSVVPVRHVLGTVPVEADGSAHFTVPANKEFFLQALDERGLAVQSMRSATYLHENERLLCAGCHEPRHRPNLSSGVAPLALRRPPSQLKPDVDGSNPFSYPRLVQPVLDKHCAECHAKNADKAPSLAREPLVGRWYASYANLVQKYGFHDYGDGYRTTPGHFGAKASKLYELLEKGHYDVRLTPEEMHRLTLWLDCSSMFYGVYEKDGGEAQLRGEIAYPTLE